MKNKVLTYIVFLLPIFVFSQKEGKIISSYGKTYEVINPGFKTDIHHDLKAVFDVGRSFKDSTKINSLFNTAARYLNMHVNAGVPFDKLKVAIVIHGSAAYDILNHKKYNSKFGVNNPNADLITALSNQGVKVILCGQTAAYRQITKEDTLPEIQLALSAMTALVQLQNENYRLINF